MRGNIVEIEGKPGLFIVADYNVIKLFAQDFYNTYYYVIPYSNPELDELIVDMSTTTEIHVSPFITDPVKVLKDKKAFTKFGHSEIRGVKLVYLERIWDTPVMPER